MLEAGGGAMYAVQIESLEQFQQKLTAILQSLEQDNSVMTMTMSDGTGSFGNFPEAQDFSSAYAQARQDLVSSFNEVTQLVNTMINVVGANAAKYKQTEQDITAKFNAILQQYGDAPISTSSTTTSSSTGTTTTATTAGTTGTISTTPTVPTQQSNGPAYATQSNSSTTTTTSPSTTTTATTSAGAA